MKNSKWYVIGLMIIGSLSNARTVGDHGSTSRALRSDTSSSRGLTKRPVVDTTQNAYATYGGSSTGNSFNLGMGLPFGGFDIGVSNFNQNYTMPAYDPYMYGGYGMGGMGMGGMGMGYPGMMGGMMGGYGMDPFMMGGMGMMGGMMPGMMGGYGMGGMGMGGGMGGGMGMGGFGY